MVSIPRGTHTEPKSPFQLFQKDSLALDIGQLAGPKEGAAASFGCFEAWAIPVRVFGVSGCVVLVLYEREGEYFVAKLARQGGEER